MPIRKQSSKKGRMNGAARRELNEKRCGLIISGKMEGVSFARVTKMVGGLFVRAALDSKSGPKEVLVRIPSAFSRRGATPLTTSSVISVFVGKDFDINIDKLSDSDRFDLIAIISRKQAAILQSDDTIPEWMTAAVTDIVVADEGGWEFDAPDDDAEVDVDTI